ncbi:MAG: ATP-grasp fold amidoligase family protein [Cellulomonas sp.]
MPTYIERARARAIREYRILRSRELRAPSFTYKRLESVRTVQAMRDYDCADPVFSINGKDKTHDWARELGVRTPELVGIYAHIIDLPWDDLPARSVLKPVRGSTSMGVFLLQRVDGGWRDLRLGRFLTTHDVTREYLVQVASGDISAAVLVEKLIVDPRVPDQPPIDYKIYTFFGRVGLTIAKGHERDGQGGSVDAYRIFDTQWRDLGDAFAGIRLDPMIPPPVRGEEMLEFARRISGAVPRGLLRVDVFEDEDGPVLGEVTPEPGGPVIVRPDVDRMLGQEWEEAEARLRVRFARAGQLSPGLVPQAEASLRRGHPRLAAS